MDKTEEYATQINWTPPWEPGAPMPVVFSNGAKLYVIYCIMDGQEYQQPGFKTIDDPGEYIDTFALVGFDAQSFKFGIANDEVFSGLPLAKKGLKYGGAHIIENSLWIQEIKNIHKVHPYYNAERWKQLKHFVLLFHDELLEVIATGYTIEVYKTSRNKILTEVITKITLP
jgi:hypothetical protein